MEPSNEQQFGELLWPLIISSPFGTPTKRELELSILQAAADAGLIDETQPAEVSAVLRLSSITKAHSYLADLSQRREPLSDLEALKLLADVLKQVEVLPNDKHLSIPLQRADLRIWLERKLAADGLHPGESLRRDIAKLTPISLLRLLDGTAKLQKPAAALKQLNRDLNQPAWVAIAQQEWTAKTSWADTVKTLGTVVSIANALPKLIHLACGS
jgi:hypothetical protein